MKLVTFKYGDYWNMVNTELVKTIKVYKGYNDKLCAEFRFATDYAYSQEFYGDEAVASLKAIGMPDYEISKMQSDVMLDMKPLEIEPAP
jgi:hypothetical protein